MPLRLQHLTRQIRFRKPIGHISPSKDRVGRYVDITPTGSRYLPDLSLEKHRELAPIGSVKQRICKIEEGKKRKEDEKKKTATS